MDPETEPFGQPLPLFHVAPDTLLALVNERFDAVRFDLLFGMDSQFLADFNLHGQTVRIPARFPLAQVAAHRAVAGKDVLDRPREAMARMRHAIGRRRTLEKDEPRRPLAPFERLFVNPSRLPKPEDFLFERREADIVRDRLKHSAARIIRKKGTAGVAGVPIG